MRLCLIVGGTIAAAALTGCGSENGGAASLTCAWLAGPDNCWSNTALRAMTCLPPENDSGTLLDGNACLYPDQSVVQFTPALVLPLPNDPEWHFKVYPPTSGACLEYDETAAGITLVAGGQTVKNNFSGLGMTIICPDGTAVQTSNALALLDCPAGLNALPGHFVGYSDISIDFAIVGTSTGTPLPVFDCRQSSTAR